MPGAIEVEQLWKYYGDYPAMRDCSLSVREGSCCALLGRNGAGKTTLLRILAGLSPYQRGAISVFGETSAQCQSAPPVGLSRSWHRHLRRSIRQ